MSVKGVKPVQYAACGLRVWVLLLLAAPVWLPANEVSVIEARSIALQGTPKYPDDFPHFDYVNPNAPRGGSIVLFKQGTFDSLNRFAQRGDFESDADQLYDSLMLASDDEISSFYPLIAEKISYASDYSFITFHINPQARFQDGKPITAQDVVFSFDKFMTQGVPFVKERYAYVEHVEAIAPLQVKFSLKNHSKEEMVRLVSFTVLPQHYWQDKDFSEPLKEVPLGSSGMTISQVDFGHHVTYQYLEDYWAKDLPVNKGRHNIQSTRYEYYRDQTVGFEAFKAGRIDLWQENISKQWATGYDFPAVAKGQVIKESIEHNIPQGMQAFIFNTGKPLFRDRRVRQAISYMMDFEWMNKHLFYNQYTRTHSFFQNTPYSAQGLPNDAQLAVLKPLQALLPEEVFTQVYQPSQTLGDGSIRQQIRQALPLLEQAGWVLRDNRLVNAQTGEPFEFELMMYSPVTERIAIPLQQNLQKIGITMHLRRVDPSQFLHRWHQHDFDMVSQGYSANLYPSTTLQLAWHSDFIDSTYNQAAVNDPAVDRLVEAIVAAQDDPQALSVYGPALDRVLLWNHYVIPQWHISQFRIAYQNKFARPAIRPTYALGLDTWWIDPTKAQH